MADRQMAKPPARLWQRACRANGHAHDPATFLAEIERKRDVGSMQNDMSGASTASIAASELAALGPIAGFHIAGGFTLVTTTTLGSVSTRSRVDTNVRADCSSVSRETTEGSSSVENIALRSVRDFTVTLRGGNITADTTLVADVGVALFNATNGKIDWSRTGGLSVEGAVGDRIVLLVEQREVDPNSTLSIVFSPFGRNYDITTQTMTQIARHMRRPVYGPGLGVFTYERPVSFNTF